MKKMITLLFLGFMVFANAQKYQHLDFSFSYSELKDQVNYDLIFRGPSLSTKYTWTNKTESRMIKFESEFGFGASFARKIAAINFNFKPVQLDYYFPINIRDVQLFLGPYASVNYNYHLYPELHSGHTYWFSAIDFGASLYFETSIKNKKFGINFNSAICGFTSRPDYKPEDYFYDIQFSDVIKNANSNFSFASWNKRYSAALGINLLGSSKKGWSVAYNLSYSAYFAEPKATYLTNTLRFKKRLGRKNEKNEKN